MLGAAGEVLWLKGRAGPAWAEFDPAWYLARYPHVGIVVKSDEPEKVLQFYLISGQQIGHSPNLYFDEKWYLQQHTDAAVAVSQGNFASGFDEYCRAGYAWRSPHWLYDDWVYAYHYKHATNEDLNPELLRSGGFANRYDHYLHHGSRAGYVAHLLFDPAYYRAQLNQTEIPALDEAGAFTHYLRLIDAGCPEPRTTCYFDPRWYRETYPVVTAALGCDWLSALHHYLANSAPTEFDPLPEFSERDYLTQNTDVAETVKEDPRLRNGYSHFLSNGVFELRAPRKSINLKQYVSEHQSVHEELATGQARDAFAHFLKTRPPNGLVSSSLLPSRNSVPPNKAETNSLVVVLGMHRSGTSLCAQILRTLGVALGDDAGATPSNPRGHWEWLEIVKRHDHIFRLFDRSYYSPNHDLPLPTGWWTDPRVIAIEEELVQLLRREPSHSGLLGFKDPRTSRLLPMWHRVFTRLQLQPKIVLCLRNPAQVARSLKRRDGLPPDLGEYRWIVYMADIFRNLQDLQVCTIEYEHWFDDLKGNLRKLVRFLSLPEERERRALDSIIVDQELRHDDPGRAVATQPIARTFYEQARRSNEPTARSEIQKMLDRLAAYEQLSGPIQAEFIRLSQMAAELRDMVNAVNVPPLVSWRHVTVEREWNKFILAAKEAKALWSSMQTVLKQRTDHDAGRAPHDAGP